MQVGLGYKFLKRSFVLIAITIASSNSVFCQYKEEYRPNHDNWPYYFGMSISYNHSSLHPSKHPLFLQNDSVLSVEPGSSGGIALGLVGTLQLSPRFSLRANPQLIIGGAKYFTYSLKYPTATERFIEKKTLPSTIVSFPLQVKFNSDRIGNFRTYLMGGVKYDMDLASNSSARNAEDLVKLNKNDYGIEAGPRPVDGEPVGTIDPGDAVPIRHSKTLREGCRSGERPDLRAASGTYRIGAAIRERGAGCRHEVIACTELSDEFRYCGARL